MASNKTNQDSIVELCLALKEATMRDTKVANVATIVQINNTEYICKILGTEQLISCIVASGLTLAVNDNVVVLFTDTDFRQILNSSNKTITNLTLHSINYGIIICKL